MFLIPVLFLAASAFALSQGGLLSCCSLGDQCFSICSVSTGIDPNCFSNCHNFYCPVCDLPPASSSSEAGYDFGVFAASSDVLSYTVLAACYLFSFLSGLSMGRK